MNEQDKKAAALLDEEQDEKESGEGAKEEKAIEDPFQQLRELCRGKLTLMHPIRAHGQDVKEIPFDFCGLTSMEMMDALDKAMVNNMFAISNGQAMELFAATAEKCAPWLEENGRKTRLYDGADVKRMSAADAVKAVQLAKLFYTASGQAGNNNISKE